MNPRSTALVSVRSNTGFDWRLASTSAVEDAAPAEAAAGPDVGRPAPASSTAVGRPSSRTVWPGWMRAAQRLGCVAIVAHHPLWTPRVVADVQGSGMRCLAYTVNEAPQAQRLWEMGLDGLITDRADLFDPAS